MFGFPDKSSSTVANESLYGCSSAIEMCWHDSAFISKVILLSMSVRKQKYNDWKWKEEIFGTIPDLLLVVLMQLVTSVLNKACCRRKRRI